MITVRDYREADAPSLWAVYYHTVHNINIRDYSREQVEAWAPESCNPDAWKQQLRGLKPFVAEINGVVVGYADLQESGLIDHFFCHHDYQGQGVGRALMNHIFALGKRRGVKRYYSRVSITARPFYERFGFAVVHEQEVVIRGQRLKNFVMEKFT